MQFVRKSPNELLMVVSKDNDWIDAFKGIERIEVRNSLDDALVAINGLDKLYDDDMLVALFEAVYEDVIEKADSLALNECYDLNEYDWVEEIEIDLAKTESVSDLFVPLIVTRGMILLQSTAALEVSGCAEVLDEGNSLWDSENGDYFYRAYSDIRFTGEVTKAKCEIEITFDVDDPIKSARLESFRFVNRWSIPIRMDDIDSSPISEDEMAHRCLREDVGYPNRRV